MKNKFGLLLLLFILLCQMSFAQKYDCGWYGKKTVEDRNKIFPFNKAKKIVLIAYGNRELGSAEHDSLSLEEAKKVNSKIINRYEINFIFKRVYFSIEEKELTGKSIEELSNVLINYQLKKKPRRAYPSGDLCYTPRNSILFYDDNNEIFCYYEICFECQASMLDPNPNDLEKYSGKEVCKKRFDIIKELFRNSGIKYGVEYW